MSNQSAAERTEEEKGLLLSCCQPGREFFKTLSIPSDFSADSAFAGIIDLQKGWNKRRWDSE